MFTARYEPNMGITFVLILFMRTVQLLRRLFACLTRFRSQMMLWEIYGERAVLAQVCFRVNGFSPVSFTPSVLRIHFHIHATLSPWAYGRNLGTRKNQCSLENIGALNRQVLLVSSLNGFSGGRIACLLYCSTV